MNKIALILLVGILSCKTKTENTVAQSNMDTSGMKTSVDTLTSRDDQQDYPTIKSLDYGKVEIVLNDTSQFFLLKGKCAIIEYPDTAWLRKYRETMPDESWNEIISDRAYYESIARDTLESKGIKVLGFLSWRKRYLKFQKADNSFYILDKAKMEDSWGIILFNGQDNPVISEELFGTRIETFFRK